MWILLLALTCLAAPAADKGAKAVYPPQRISARGIERIEITGVRGQLHLVGRGKKQYQLVVKHSKKRSEDWSLLVERRGKTLVLEVSNAAWGREWRKVIKREQWPEFDIALYGPAKPTVVSWRDGDLNYQTWAANVETSFLNGTVKIGQGKGDYILQAVKADLTVDGFDGDLKVKGESGRVSVKDLSGSLDLNWLSGMFTATAVQGKVNIDSRRLETLVQNGRGNWDMNLAEGLVNIQGFSGKFKGRGQSAVWRVSGGSRSDFELVSTRGAVDIDWGAPARVFLTSERGNIRAPYAWEDRDGKRVAQGKRGIAPLGQVFVKTDSGAITFKH